MHLLNHRNKTEENKMNKTKRNKRMNKLFKTEQTEEIYNLFIFNYLFHLLLNEPNQILLSSNLRNSILFLFS